MSRPSSIKEIDVQLASQYAKYLRMAEAGDPAAQYEVGLFLQTGTGVKADLAEAAKWFHAAAEQDYADAQFCLGICFRTGAGVDINPEKAAKWYRAAAAQDHLEAQFNLAYLLHNETDAKKHLEEIVHYYQKAAARDHAGALNNLGFCFEKGFGVGKDPAKAVEYYQKASAKGVANAQCNLAFCLEAGYGVAQDLENAVHWYRQSAERGFAIAQYYLGRCLENGIGTKSDLTEALTWYHESAKQNYADAQFKLGNFLEKGTVVKTNSSGSILWYCRAALQGQKDAIKSLTRKPPFTKKLASSNQVREGHDEFNLFNLRFREDTKNIILTTEEIIEVINGMKSVGRAKSDESRVIGDLVVFSFSQGAITNKADLNHLLATLVSDNPTLNPDHSISCLMIRGCIAQLDLPTVKTSSAGAGIDLSLNREDIPSRPETKTLTPPSSISEATITTEMLNRGVQSLLADRKNLVLLTDGTAATESTPTDDATDLRFSGEAEAAAPNISTITREPSPVSATVTALGTERTSPMTLLSTDREAAVKTLSGALGLDEETTASVTSQNLAGSEERAIQPPSREAEINPSMLIDLEAVSSPSAGAGVELGSSEMLASEVVLGNTAAGGAGIALGFTEPVIVEDFSAAEMTSPAATAALEMAERSSSPRTLVTDAGTEIKSSSSAIGTALSFGNEHTAASTAPDFFGGIEEASSATAAARTQPPLAAASEEVRRFTTRTAKSAPSNPSKPTTTSKRPIAQAYLRSITQTSDMSTGGLRPLSAIEADSPSIKFDPSAARALSDKHKSPHKKE